MALSGFLMLILDREEEKQIINDCYSSILKLSGHPPVGWHTKSSTSPFTRDLLIEHGGLYMILMHIMTTYLMY